MFEHDYVSPEQICEPVQVNTFSEDIFVYVRVGQSIPLLTFDE